MIKRIVIFLLISTLLLFIGCNMDGSSEPTATLTLINNSSHILLGLWATDSSNPSWGSSLMGSTLNPGSSRNVTIPAGPSIDFATESATHYWEVYGIVIVEGDTYFWEILDSEAIAF